MRFGSQPLRMTNPEPIQLSAQERQILPPPLQQALEALVALQPEPESAVGACQALNGPEAPRG